MSGPAIIRHLIAHDTAMLTLLGQMSSSASSVIVGKLKASTPLPAISIRQVSGTEELTVAMTEGGRLKTQRVQVMVHAKTGKQQLQLMDAVLAACPNTAGSLNGVHVDSVLPAGEGPDLSDPEVGTYEQSRDFMVRWHGS